MWELHLRVNSDDVDSLASALITEEVTNIDSGILHMHLNEMRAKDLRAIWNTRIRSMIIARSLLDVMDS